MGTFLRECEILSKINMYFFILDIKKSLIDFFVHEKIFDFSLSLFAHGDDDDADNDDKCDSVMRLLFLCALLENNTKILLPI